MAEVCNYSRTFSSLKKLQNLLRCKKCENVTQGLYTLGSCEHLFCRNCCDKYVGNECPVCSIPGHVKDATVIRPMSNIVGLCQELHKILLQGQPGLDCKKSLLSSKSTTLQDELECTPQNGGNVNKSTDVSGEDGRQIQNGGQEISADVNFTSDGKTNDDSASKGDDNKQLNQRSNTRQTKSKNQPENSELKGGNSITQKCKNTRMVKRAMNEAQTTMTQFYDLDGEDDEDDEIMADEDDDIMDDDDPVYELQTRQSFPRSSTTTPGTKVKARTGRSLSPSTGPRRKVAAKGRKSANITKKTGESSISSKEANTSFSTPQSKKKSRSRTSTPTLTTPQSKKKVGLASPANLTTPRSKKKVGQASTANLTTPQSKIKAGQPSTPNLNGSFISSSGRSVSKSQQIKRNAKGETPLHVAAIKGDYEKVVELLENGASTNVRENAGWTPLHEAVNNGHVRIAKVLLEHGAMINTPGLDNDTPLHDAINSNRLDCVRLLVSKGASLTLRNIHGLTPRDLIMTDMMREALDTPVQSQITDTSLQVEEDELYQPACFLATGLSREDKIQLQKCACILQAKVVDDFTPEVTHVITSCNKTGMAPRTLKYLRGVLLGKWIVNMEWISTCLEFASRVSEEGFEVPGSSTNPDSHAPYKGRMNRKQQLPGFFDGCQFYFHGIFEYPTPEKEEMMELVKAGDGKILTREPKLQNLDEYPVTVPYHAGTDSRFKDCSIFIVHDSNLAYPEIKSERMCAVPASWVLESISSFTFKDI